MAQFAEIEAEPAFEKDQCDADADHRIEQGSKGVFGIEKAQNRPCQESCGKHHDDCRPTGTPGEPLRADAEHADHCDDECLFHAPLLLRRCSQLQCAVEDANLINARSGDYIQTPQVASVAFEFHQAVHADRLGSQLLATAEVRQVDHEGGLLDVGTRFAKEFGCGQRRASGR